MGRIENTTQNISHVIILACCAAYMIIETGKNCVTTYNEFRYDFRFYATPEVKQLNASYECQKQLLKKTYNLKLDSLKSIYNNNLKNTFEKNEH